MAWTWGRSQQTGRVAALVVAVALAAAACSSSGGDGDSAHADATTTTAEAERLTVLVTNDDGVDAPGIDALVEGLLGLGDVDVTVVAPADQRSGTGDQSTEGVIAFEETTTASGYPAVAVDGFPADSVNVALDEVLDEPPDVVISGINSAPNLANLVHLSGTVGAAREAVRRGVPALASSQGQGEPPDYASGVEQVLAWLEDHRDDLLAGTATVQIWNLNIPTCPTGEVRAIVEVPTHTATDLSFEVVDCTSGLEDPIHDVDAFVNGFAPLAVLDPELTGVPAP